MNKQKVTIYGHIPRKKNRAIELYAANSPFKQKVVERKDLYQRKPKHRNRDE